MQKWWDEQWSRQNMLLILCGSVTSMMHRETLAHSSPLYGRSDGQVLLLPMPYSHVKDFCRDNTQRELVERYALCGGVPRYLELLEPYDNFDTALRDGIINSLSPMASEARNLLLEEVEVPNTCWSLMETISGGSTRISEIAGKLGLPANQITRYLDILKDLYIVARETPVLEKNPAKSKKGTYTVTDPFLRLWFGCIYPYESLFEFGNVERGLTKIQPLLQNHLSFCFEELARAFLKYSVDRFDAVKIGRQWDRHYEIDAAGINRHNQLSVVGECKWSNLKVGISVLNDLEKTIADYNLPVADTLQYVLFSKSGFTKELMHKAATRSDVHLITNLFELR